ncbi:MAG: hypothetical protein JW844_06605 [Candidatus Omnitrophica bacterium]|nr:hypothetical protein [Candidatus Omnitrophota bacterium]
MQVFIKKTPLKKKRNVTLHESDTVDVATCMHIRMRRRSQTGFTILEFTICFFIALIFFCFILMHLESTLKTTRESALKQELGTLRKCVKVWYVFNDGYPRDLRELFAGRMFGSSEPSFNPELLTSIAQDEYGYPVDPFRNRYMYDPMTGKVSSTTPGQEFL